MRERQVAVVLHDVAPATWPACERLLDCLAGIDASLPLTWLVVPRYHGSALRSPALDWALDSASARGDDLALHGYTHRDDGPPATSHAEAWRRRWYTQGEGEFAALDADTARQRLADGRAWFAAHGWPVHGFVPPAWLAGPGARAALEGAGFDYTCTLSRLIALPRPHADGTKQGGASLRSQSIVYSTRAAWRRSMSCAWNPAVAWSQRHGSLLRFELHPWDADHADVRRSWTRLLAQALRTRRPVTLLEAVHALRGSQSTPPPGATDHETRHRAALHTDQSGHSSSMPLPMSSPASAPASTSLG